MKLNCLPGGNSRFFGAALSLWSIALTGMSSEPAYDCAKASGQVEQLICSDEALAALDRSLADTYRVALQNFPQAELASLQAEQRGWIKGRNDCWKAEDVSSCVRLSYQTRIVELQITSGQLIAAEAVGYACEGNEGRPFFAAFYSQTTPASVVLTLGNDQLIAFIAPSGSGARYSAAGVEFWEHHGEASVNWFGMEFKCQAIQAP